MKKLTKEGILDRLEYMKECLENVLEELGGE